MCGIGIEWILDKFLVLACRIKGQIREDCAPDPSCFQTCNIINGMTSGPPCLERCAVNGCVCPNGTVFSEERFECVTPDQCKGIQIIMIVCGSFYEINFII